MYSGEEEGGVAPDDHVMAYHEMGLDTDSLFEGLISGTEKTIEDVESGLWYTPQDLSLPYADHGWARKQEMQRKGEERLDLLKRALEAVEKELARCERNLRTILGDRELVNLDATIEKYDRATLAQRDQHYLVKKQKEQLIDVIERLEEVLNEARSRVYPGEGDPEENIQSAALASMVLNLGMGGELGSLMSLGPLDSRQNQRRN